MIKKLSLFIFSILIYVAGVNIAAADKSVEDIANSDKSAINALASTIAPLPQRVDLVLSEMNFQKYADSIPDFKDWPALRKIEAAYFSAVAAGGPNEGVKFLHVFARVVAEDHSNAILHEDALKPYLNTNFTNGNKLVRTSVAFAAIKGAPAEPGAEVRAAILATEKYVDLMPGGMQSVMGVCCGLHPDDAYRILRVAKNRADALEQAIANGEIPQELRDRLLRLIQATAENSHAITYEPDLKPYLDALGVTVDEPSALVVQSMPSAPALSLDDEQKLDRTFRSAAKNAGLNDQEVDKAISLLGSAASDQAKGHASNPTLKGPDRGNGSEVASAHAPTSPHGSGGSAWASEASAHNLQNYLDTQNSIVGAGSSGNAPGATSLFTGQGESADGSLTSSSNAAGGSAGGGTLGLPSANGGSGGGGGGGGLPNGRPGGGGGPEIGTAGGGEPHIKFELMRVSGRGFGGVVFGNTVTSELNNKPSQLIWVADGDSGWGHFDVVLTEGTVVMTRRMRQNELYAAWEIVNGKLPEFGPLDLIHQEGVGLASVVRREVGPNEPNMLVHPALYGLEIGNAAAMADAIGFKMGSEAFRHHLTAASVSPEAIEKATSWHDMDKGYYKILDAPLRITMFDGLLRTERMNSDEDYPLKLRQVGFLEFQALDDDDKPISKTPFYEILPALVTAFPAFERLNSFAETFAIIRWAKLSGATITPPPEVKPTEALLRLMLAPDGDLFQSSPDASVGTWAAIRLADIARTTEGALVAIRSTNAPEPAVHRLMDIRASSEDIVAVQASISILDGYPGDKQINTLREQLFKRLFDDQQNMSDLEEDGFLLSILDQKEFKSLIEKRNKYEEALSKLEDSKNKVDSQELIDLRFIVLPDQLRNSLKSKYDALKETEAKVDLADTDQEAEKYEKKAAELRVKLEGLLPPINQVQIDFERARQQANLSNQTIEANEREETYRRALAAAKSEWFGPVWTAVSHLASTN